MLNVIHDKLCKRTTSSLKKPTYKYGYKGYTNTLSSSIPNSILNPIPPIEFDGNQHLMETFPGWAKNVEYHFRVAFKLTF